MARGQKRVGKSNSNTSAAKKLVPESPVASPEVQNDPVPRPETPQNVISPKHFVLKHTFNNVSSMEEGEDRCSSIEDHFGLKLYISMDRSNGYFGLYLMENTRQWYLSIEGHVRIFGRKEYEAIGKGTVEGPPFFSIAWQEVSKWESISHFLVDDSLTVEHEIRIYEMAKLGKKVLRSFDTAMEDVSDVVLIVRNQKFYVSKYTLSAHSQYFKALFLGPYKEANMREITLNGVDPFDMQNYLEFLYLQPSITDDTVEFVLKHTFKNMSSMAKEEYRSGPIEDHFPNRKVKEELEKEV